MEVSTSKVPLARALVHTYKASTQIWNNELHLYEKFKLDYYRINVKVGGDLKNIGVI